MAKRGLGRGLDTLFNDAKLKKQDIVSDSTSPQSSVTELKIIEVEPNKEQPRKIFDDQAITSLCESIKEHGIITPILVSQPKNGFYQIIAGERRWRAAKMAGLKTIPCIIKELSDETSYELTLIENLQREDLNPIEEAIGYKKLMDDFSLTQDQISKKVSKSRPAIANALRLLTLPKSVITLIEEKKLSIGHAKVILSCQNAKKQQELAKIVAETGISVRELEKLLVDKNKKQPSPKKEDLNLKLAIMEIEKQISESLGSKVKIVQGKNKGKIEIEYYSTEELEKIVNLLK